MVDEAVKAARAALKGPWGRMPLQDRVDMLRKIAAGIDKRFDDFLAAEVADTGKTGVPRQPPRHPARRGQFPHFRRHRAHLRYRVLFPRHAGRQRCRQLRHEEASGRGRRDLALEPAAAAADLEACAGAGLRQLHSRQAFGRNALNRHPARGSDARGRRAPRRIQRRPRLRTRFRRANSSPPTPRWTASLHRGNRHRGTAEKTAAVRARSAAASGPISVSIPVSGSHAASEKEILWALRNVSFEVRRGDVLGIVGETAPARPPSSRSLSRITEPTEGYAELHGRVGSLLEVGVGFHSANSPAGRTSNLNGTVLGMKKWEIDEKFDEIVAFAEIEKFLDTPVKRYSSGMYVRLAFAVAAHLEPEILIVDEVLAVGDAAFQKKCLGKMGDVARGSHVLFVSHNMALFATCALGRCSCMGDLWYGKDQQER